MTRLQIVSQIRIFMGETDSANSTFTDPEAVDQANFILPQLASQIEELLTWRDYTTAAGTERYSLPSDYLKLKGLELEVTTDRRREMLFVTHKKYAELSYGSSTQQSEPRIYKIEIGAVDQADPPVPGDFWVYPLPNDNGGSNYKLRLRYFQRPDDMTVDTDVPELPEYVHMAIVYKAAQALALRKSDHVLASFLEGLFQQDMREAKRATMQLQRDRPGFTQDVMGYTETDTDTYNSRRGRY